jgi:cell wall-associated NlpC family hydrolase
LKRFYSLLLTFSLGTVGAHAATKTVKHKIKSGETLYTIAHKNHTTIEEVRKANGLKKGETLKIGKVLTVPKNTYFPNKKKKIVKADKKSKKIAKRSKKHTVKKSVKSKKYVIKRGDTLLAIAKKQHTTVEKIRKANGMKKGETLRLGKVLKIPGKYYSAPAKKRKSRIAHTRTKKQDKKLAKAIMRIKTKKPAKAAKRSHFAFSDIFFHGSSKSKNIINLAKKKLGKRYVWGAVGQRNTFDCSGLTSYVCKKNGIHIPRRAIEQSKYGKYVSRDHLKPGDLIFFDTSKRRKGYVNHVGIYIGNNKFIHASSAKKKVVITSLSKPFYSKRYKGARRVAS